MALDVLWLIRLCEYTKKCIKKEEDMFFILFFFFFLQALCASATSRRLHCRNIAAVS